MKYQPVVKNNKIIFDLKKPIYGSFYGIWDKWLKKAKKENLKLVIKFNEGVVLYNSVNEFLKGAKKIERYYKNPNEPMIFYGRDLYPDFIKQKKEKERLEEETTPFISFEAKLKLLEVWKKIKSKSSINIT